MESSTIMTLNQSGSRCDIESPRDFVPLRDSGSPCDFVSLMNSFGEGKTSSEQVFLYIENQEDFSNILVKPKWSSQVTPQTRKYMDAYFTHYYPKLAPWKFFVLAKHAQLHPITIQRILTLYAQDIQFHRVQFGPDSKMVGAYYTVTLNPSHWFGNLIQTGELSKEIQKILCARFDELISQYSSGTIFRVETHAGWNFDLPKNFHYNLVRNLLDRKIFVDCRETCPCISKKIPFMHHPALFNAEDMTNLLED